MTNNIIMEVKMSKESVKIIPLGGQAEMGKSMYCIEVNEKIFIIDAGFRFPEVSKLGVDIIIPSFDFLKENEDRVVAVIITHGHDDVMAAEVPEIVPCGSCKHRIHLIVQYGFRYFRECPAVCPEPSGQIGYLHPAVSSGKS